MMLAACVDSSEFKVMELTKSFKTESTNLRETFSICLTLKRVKSPWRKLDLHGEVGFLLVESLLQECQIKRKDFMSGNSWTPVTPE
jgi:hypothetical protein